MGSSAPRVVLVHDARSNESWSNDANIRDASSNFCLHVYDMKFRFCLFLKLLWEKKRTNEKMRVKMRSKDESTTSKYNCNVSTYNLNGIIV